MILCFDIGGTTMKGGRARSPTDIDPLPRVPTPTRDFAAFTAVLARAIAGCPQRPRCLVLAIPGIVERPSGQSVIANVPCASNRRLGPELEEALGLPVILGNDADCFALAEAVAGAGRGHRVVFGAILGTGVGGGLVVDGRLINEAGGFAGEWGHGPVAARLAGSPPIAIPHFACGCGLSGCLDSVISARGMERLHRHLTGTDAPSTRIVAAWEGGEQSPTIDIFLEVAAAPMAMLANMVGADIIPVGGGLSESAPLIEALDRAVRPLCLARIDRPLVVPALCRGEPGLIGAASLGFASLEG